MANMETNTTYQSTNTETVALVDGRQDSFTPRSTNSPVTQRMTQSVSQTPAIEPCALPTFAERMKIEAEVLATLEKCGGIADIDLLSRWPGWMTPPIAAPGVHKQRLAAAFAAGNQEPPSAPVFADHEVDAAKVLCSLATFQEPTAEPVVTEREAVAAEVLRSLAKSGGVANRELLDRWPAWMTEPIAAPDAYAPGERAALAIAAAPSGPLFFEFDEEPMSLYRTISVRSENLNSPSLEERAVIEADVLAELNRLGGLANQALWDRWPGWMTPPITDSNVRFRGPLEVIAACMFPPTAATGAYG